MQSNAVASIRPVHQCLPSTIKAQLDAVVSGEDEAKKYLASIVFKHVSHLTADSGVGSKSHVLVLGPTGAGKSYLVEALRDAVDVPLVTVDATTLTEAGYHGRDVDQIFDDLLREAGQDRAKAETGIVFVDEFDKLRAATGSERDIRGSGVQYSLLKILDGAIRQVSATRTSRLHSAGNVDSQRFCTNKLLFVFAGAFSEHPHLLEQSIVEPKDIARLGFLQELAARIPNVIRLKGLDSRYLTRALENADQGLLSEYSLLFRAMGCSLAFSSAARQRVSDEVVRMAIGYRGLRAVLDRVLLPLLHCIESTARGPDETRPVTIDFDGYSFLIQGPQEGCSSSVSQS